MKAGVRYVALGGRGSERASIENPNTKIPVRRVCLSKGDISHLRKEDTDPVVYRARPFRAVEISPPLADVFLLNGVERAKIRGTVDEPHS